MYDISNVTKPSIMIHYLNSLSTTSRCISNEIWYLLRFLRCEENSDKCNNATAFDNLNIQLIKILTQFVS